MIAALVATGLIFTLFFWCACVLAGRADDAIENWLNEDADRDDAAAPAATGTGLHARPGGGSSRSLHGH